MDTKTRLNNVKTVSEVILIWKNYCLVKENELVYKPKQFS